MSARLGALVVHGIGSQRPGFAQPLIDEVSARLEEDAARVAWQEAFWADALEPRERALWAAMQGGRDADGEPLELDWQRLRRFVVHSFGDAVAYQRDFNRRGNAYRAIHRLVGQAIRRLTRRLGDPQAPVVVLAHSLGGHIASNYLWDRQHAPRGRPDPLPDLPGLAGLVTFGCNIALFALAFRVPRPIDLPGRALAGTPVADAVRWLNFYDPDDLLGWPVGPVYAPHRERLTARQRATVERIEDRAINAGGLLTSWNPAAHMGYWSDDDLTRPVARYLSTLLAQLSS